MYSSIGTDLVVIPIVNGQFDSSAFVRTLKCAPLYLVFLNKESQQLHSRAHAHFP
jgi:hypothetical protein